MNIYYPIEQNIIEEDENMILDRIALFLCIVGALNWGSIGLFRFDIVAWIFGGQGELFSRIVYTLVAISGAWLISLFFRERETAVAID
jgi:uncharacterized membrane protein YuzA (DUF378 family)